MDDNRNPTSREGKTPRRPQPVLSCLTCKRMKLKCDRRLPCERCCHNGRAGTCAYAPGQEPLAITTNNATAKKRQRKEATYSPLASAVTTANFDELQARVRQLERALEAQHAQSSPVAQVHLGPTEVLDGSRPVYEAPENGHLHDQTLGHAVVTQFEAVRSFVDGLNDTEASEELHHIAFELRSLHESIRRNQMSLHSDFHIYDNMQAVLAHMERLLPAPDICTALIQLYFHNFENCTRVLHRGTAWTQFRAYFNETLVSGTRHICLPLLTAVVSIASSLGTLPECNNSRLHGQDDGIGAYQLLRNYLDLIDTRQWKDLTIMQLAALTLKYQKSCPLTPAESWHWSGQVLRRAMAGGLHKINSRKHDIFESEAKKRLWLSLLEMDLTHAIASDMPPNCPTWHNDPPLNVNDSILRPGITERPQARNLEEWTDGTCQHVLAQSFNERLAAYRVVSSGTTAPYSTILEHTRHLEHIIHDLPTIFRLVSMAEDASDTPPHRLLAKMELDFLLRRPLNACYAPYAAEMPLDDRYKESRILWIQGVSFSICFQDLFDPKYPSLDLPQPEGLWDYFYNVYSWDAHNYFLANCLELQRLRSMQTNVPDIMSPAYHGHTLRTSVKVAGWNIEGITKSLEDTIDPLARRIGRHGSSLRDVVRWTAVIGSLRVTPTCSRHNAIKNELQGLVSFLKGRTLAYGQHEETAIRYVTASQGRPSDLEWLQTYLTEAEDDEELVIVG